MTMPALSQTAGPDVPQRKIPPAHTEVSTGVPGVSAGGKQAARRWLVRRLAERALEILKESEQMDE